MTYYRRADEAQRKDEVLRELVKYELEDLYDVLSSAKEKLEEAMNLLNRAGDIEEDSLSQSSGLIEAKVSIRLAIQKFGYKIKDTPTETYVGNVAAFMPPDKVHALKQKYMVEDPD